MCNVTKKPTPAGVNPGRVTVGLIVLTYRTSWPLLLIASGAFIIARGWGT